MTENVERHVASPELPIVRPALPGLDELQPLLEEAWRTGRVTTGPIVRQLESEVADWLGVEHAVMLNHGATALMLALRGLGLSGEVIIPSFTWSATAAALIWNGLEPVFADVEPGRLTLNPDAAEAAITERTSAIMPVNVFGVPPEMEAFERIAARHGLRIVHDSAQGLGSRYRGTRSGGFGDAECFSMSPTKVITAMEGGLITTADAELAAAARSMRDSGKRADGLDIVHVGLSGRPGEVHAAVALLNLRRAEVLLAHRLEYIGWYRELLGDVPGVRLQRIPPHVVSTGNYFVIFIRPAETGVDREAVYTALARGGIQAKRYFYPAVHRQAAFAELGAAYEGRLPVTERAASEGLALPLFEGMTRLDVERVAGTVLETLGTGVPAA